MRVRALSMTILFLASILSIWVNGVFVEDSAPTELAESSIQYETQGQGFEWLWGDVISGDNYEFGNAMVSDSAGNLYVGGSYNGGYIEQNDTFYNNTGTYPEYPPAYTSDIFLAKYNSTGGLVWFQTFGESNSSESLHGIALAPNGDLVICGNAGGNFTLGQHTVNFSQTISRKDWLAGINSSGQVNWVKPMENAGLCIDRSSIKISPQTGNIYTIGEASMDRNSSFGGVVVNNTNWSANDDTSYVVKFNATGDFQWKYEIDAENGTFENLDIYSYSFEEFNTEYVYTSGFITSANGLHFEGSGITLQCDSPCWTRDPFVAKIDGSTGQISWATKATTLPTNASSWTHGTQNQISVDGSGNAIIVGEFSAESISFSSNGNPIVLNHTGPESNLQTTDGYIAKIDATGSWQWAKKVGDVSVRNEWISDVDVDVGGNAIISGGFKAESITIGNTTLNNSYSNAFDSDLFVAAINTDGEWLWANSTQSTQFDNGDLIALSSSTTGYVMGQTFGGITWGNDSDSTTYGGANQIFIGKFTFPSLITDSDLDGVDDYYDLCPNTPAGETVDLDGCSDSQLDDDGDGVMNDADLCPGTAAGASVDADGCSLGQVDTDGDGVSDLLDNCPNTPPGETVDIYGCSDSQLDDDSDGVMNNADLCPNTPPGETVDANGCAQSQLDDDGDGVMNNADLCPNTAAGETVDANGCAQSQLDDDSDGVMNNADLCPNTPPGETVDAVGCAPSQYDGDGDGVPDLIDQCPNTPSGVNVGADGCNYPPVCDISYEDGVGNVVSLQSQLAMGTGTSSSSLSLPTGTYQFIVECTDPESDMLTMTVIIDGGSAMVFTGSPLSTGGITVPVQDGMTLSKTITYYWVDGLNYGTYEIEVSLIGDDTADPNTGWLPGFELWITLLSIIASLFFNRTRKII